MGDASGCSGQLPGGSGGVFVVVVGEVMIATAAVFFLLLTTIGLLLSLLLSYHVGHVVLTGLVAAADHRARGHVFEPHLFAQHSVLVKHVRGDVFYHCQVSLGRTQVLAKGDWNKF